MCQNPGSPSNTRGLGWHQTHRFGLASNTHVWAGIKHTCLGWHQTYRFGLASNTQVWAGIKHTGLGWHQTYRFGLASNTRGLGWHQTQRVGLASMQLLYWDCFRVHASEAYPRGFMIVPFIEQNTQKRLALNFVSVFPHTFGSWSWKRQQKASHKKNTASVLKQPPNLSLIHISEPTRRA